MVTDEDRIAFMAECGVLKGNGIKYDLQLSASKQHEIRLAGIFTSFNRVAKLELKTETKQWEDTGNIAIEFACRGKPSGIAATEADVWVHELRRDGATLCYLMFTRDRLRELCRNHGRRVKGGDGGLSDLYILRLKDILR